MTLNTDFNTDSINSFGVDDPNTDVDPEDISMEGGGGSDVALLLSGNPAIDQDGKISANGQVQAAVESGLVIFSVSSLTATSEIKKYVDLGKLSLKVTTNKEDTSVMSSIASIATAIRLQVAKVLGEIQSEIQEDQTDESDSAQTKPQVNASDDAPTSQSAKNSAAGQEQDPASILSFSGADIALFAELFGEFQSFADGNVYGDTVVEYTIGDITVSASTYVYGDYLHTSITISSGDYYKQTVSSLNTETGLTTTSITYFNPDFFQQYYANSFGINMTYYNSNDFLYVDKSVPGFGANNDIALEVRQIIVDSINSKEWLMVLEGGQISIYGDHANSGVYSWANYMESITVGDVSYASHVHAIDVVELSSESLTILNAYNTITTPLTAKTLVGLTHKGLHTVHIPDASLANPLSIALGVGTSWIEQVYDYTLAYDDAYQSRLGVGITPQQPAGEWTSVSTNTSGFLAGTSGSITDIDVIDSGGAEKIVVTGGGYASIYNGSDHTWSTPSALQIVFGKNNDGVTVEKTYPVNEVNFVKVDTTFTNMVNNMYQQVIAPSWPYTDPDLPTFPDSPPFLDPNQVDLISVATDGGLFLSRDGLSGESFFNYSYFLSSTQGEPLYANTPFVLDAYTPNFPVSPGQSYNNKMLGFNSHGGEGVILPYAIGTLPDFTLAEDELFIGELNREVTAVTITPDGDHIYIASYDEINNNGSRVDKFDIDSNYGSFTKQTVLDSTDGLGANTIVNNIIYIDDDRMFASTANISGEQGNGQGIFTSSDTETWQLFSELSTTNDTYMQYTSTAGSKYKLYAATGDKIYNTDALALNGFTNDISFNLLLEADKSISAIGIKPDSTGSSDVDANLLYGIESTLYFNRSESSLSEEDFAHDQIGFHHTSLDYKSFFLPYTKAAGADGEISYATLGLTANDTVSTSMVSADGTALYYAYYTENEAKTTVTGSKVIKVDLTSEAASKSTVIDSSFGVTNFNPNTIINTIILNGANIYLSSSAEKYDTNGELVNINARGDGIFISTNNGSSWENYTIEAGMLDNLMSKANIYFFENELYVVTQNNIYKTADHGQTFTDVAADYTANINNGIRAAAFYDDDIYFAENVLIKRDTDYSNDPVYVRDILAINTRFNENVILKDTSTGLFSWVDDPEPSHYFRNSIIPNTETAFIGKAPFAANILTLQNAFYSYDYYGASDRLTLNSTPEPVLVFPAFTSSGIAFNPLLFTDETQLLNKTVAEITELYSDFPLNLGRQYPGLASDEIRLAELKADSQTKKTKLENELENYAEYVSAKIQGMIALMPQENISLDNFIDFIYDQSGNLSAHTGFFRQENARENYFQPELFISIGGKDMFNLDSILLFPEGIMANNYYSGGTHRNHTANTSQSQLGNKKYELDGKYLSGSEVMIVKAAQTLHMAQALGENPTIVSDFMKSEYPSYIPNASYGEPINFLGDRLDFHYKFVISDTYKDDGSFAEGSRSSNIFDARIDKQLDSEYDYEYNIYITQDTGIFGQKTTDAYVIFKDHNFNPTGESPLQYQIETWGDYLLYEQYVTFLKDHDLTFDSSISDHSLQKQWHSIDVIDGADSAKIYAYRYFAEESYVSPPSGSTGTYVPNDTVAARFHLLLKDNPEGTDPYPSIYDDIQALLSTDSDEAVLMYNSLFTYNSTLDDNAKVTEIAHQLRDASTELGNIYNKLKEDIGGTDQDLTGYRDYVVEFFDKQSGDTVEAYLDDIVTGASGTKGFYPKYEVENSTQELGSTFIAYNHHALDVWVVFEDNVLDKSLYEYLAVS